ncbi:MAG TPA: heparan-alpha-glucosaminide N-acetyltransferase [Methylomusa anaerophila]|uniref:Acyltransferase family protein n=1 Tax=Methylomusa anaerophila TaxID=1930071 RepID=A0A348AJE1_9FIRM|nr:heparan-alpha-glucosaminide N-acetyltransferase [Methylomusa anaerophila]BBB91189.1 acyltransferase family protein [Methylomusa anaerophila]HML89066.1 heparan-alpha-glucosaminide N-acetyltransferase [Methylomusa anaerophila]
MLKKPGSSRIWEIDLWRGIAIILMIAFHLIFDLAEFYHYDFKYFSGFWYLEGKTAAVLFMFLSGVSSTLSANPAKRGLQVLAAGLVLTIVTYLFSPEIYIRFGILHLLGCSMLAANYFRSLAPPALLAFGTAAILSGHLLSLTTGTSPLLIPFGLTPPGFQSLDYYPLLPWGGVVLYGVAAGITLYPNKETLWPNIPQNILLPTLPLRWLGRRSLTIYLVHQPILLAFLYLIHILLHI